MATKLPILKSREELERCVGEFAGHFLERERLLNELEARIQALRTEYEAAVAGVTAAMEDAGTQVEAWAEAHPEDFTARKSLDCTHGTIGFRTGTPKLKTLSGITWDRVLERLADKAPEYIRTKRDPDKEKIIADRATLDLSALGVKVVQDESFFIELKREAAPESTSAA